MLKKYKEILIILAIVIIIIIGLIGYFYQNKQVDSYSYLEITNEGNEVKTEIDNKEKIIIHITGQVINQGIIELDEGSRVANAIEIAGGVTQKADLSKINLAYIVSDGEKIYIPSIEDKDKEYVTENIENSSNNKIMININTASKEELQKVPGIGETIAERIIKYRKQNGKFSSIEQIKEVSGIGDSKYEKIKEYICIK